MASTINANLAALFRNGTGEVGLEVGVDPGLAARDYIQIPRSMVKPWAATLANPRNYHYKTTKGETRASVDAMPDPRDWDDSLAPSDYASEFGWISSGDITIHNGTLWTSALVVNSDVEGEVGVMMYFELDEIHVTPPTEDDIAKFYRANVGHVPDSITDEATLMWVHAVRFWSLVSGFVTGGKSPECVVVDDPDMGSPPPEQQDVVNFIAQFSANAWTAAAARATSWRKSNHATGGDRVAGFPRRWLQKMGYLTTQADKARQLPHEREVTTAFYAATHAAQVHPVLALMASDDPNNWAVVNPSCGIIENWEVKPSTQIRMVPNTQVAGAAMVVDAVVALKMLVKEGIAPLLANSSQVGPLVNAYNEVENHGVRAASYARWYLDGHPEGVSPIEFNQKDPVYAELVGELAVVATKYYQGTAIAGSAALQNAVNQLADENSRNHWSALARERKAASSAQLAAAYSRIKGAASMEYVAGLVSNDRDVASQAVIAYNARTSTFAGMLGITSPVSLDFDTVFKPSSAPSE